jgi:hypothetical protein
VRSTEHLRSSFEAPAATDRSIGCSSGLAFCDFPVNLEVLACAKAGRTRPIENVGFCVLDLLPTFLSTFPQCVAQFCKLPIGSSRRNAYCPTPADPCPGMMKTSRLLRPICCTFEFLVLGLKRPPRACSWVNQVAGYPPRPTDIWSSERRCTSPRFPRPKSSEVNFGLGECPRMPRCSLGQLGFSSCCSYQPHSPTSKLVGVFAQKRTG